MEALLYFALWAGLFFLMMRACHGAHVTGHGHGRASGCGWGGGNQNTLWSPPEKDKDPVCGKNVTTATAKPSIHAGRAYYFCSRDCREIFEAAPELYLQESAEKRGEMEHSHA